MFRILTSAAALTVMLVWTSDASAWCCCSKGYGYGGYYGGYGYGGYGGGCCGWGGGCCGYGGYGYPHHHHYGYPAHYGHAPMYVVENADKGGKGGPNADKGGDKGKGGANNDNNDDKGKGGGKKSMPPKKGSGEVR